MTERPAGPFAAGRASGRSRNRLAVGLVVVILLVVGVILFSSATKLDRSDVRAAVDATADELERTPVEGLGLNLFHVEEAATAANRDGGGKFSRNVAAQLRVKSAGKDSRGDRYEFTNSDGDHPVCLTVRVEINLTGQAPSFPSTSVTDGPC